MTLNASEMALLQRLQGPALPRRPGNGDLMGPLRVWLRLLRLLEEALGQSDLVSGFEAIATKQNHN